MTTRLNSTDLRRAGRTRPATFVAASLLLCLATIGHAASGIQYRAEFTDEEILAALDPHKPDDRILLAAKEAAEAAPENPDLMVELGRLYFARAWMPEARSAFVAAAEMDPDLAQAWNNAGVAEDIMGRLSQAASSFRRAVAADPLNSEAHYNLATVLERNGDFDGSVRHYKAALRIRPELANFETNPRAPLARNLLPVQIAMYLETVGGRSLPLQVTQGPSKLSAPVPPSPGTPPAESAAAVPPPTELAPDAPPTPPAPAEDPAPAIPDDEASPPAESEAPNRGRRRHHQP